MIFNRFGLFGGLVLGAALMVACGGNGFADDVQSAVDQVRADFSAAFGAGDTKAIAAMVDDEAIWMPPGEKAIVGKEAIVAFYAAYFTANRSTLELEPSAILTGAGLAVISGEFTRTDEPKAGGAVTQASGHYLFVLKQQPDGSWKIARDIWNDTIRQ